MSDPRGYLLVAINAMLDKAYSPKNLSKPSWTDLTNEEVDNLIGEELNEFIDAFEDGDTTAILNEAVDLLAFAAMRADPMRGTDD
jgi:phosphoribosyl-ATP pyrophosphohydrolase